MGSFETYVALTQKNLRGVSCSFARCPSLGQALTGFANRGQNVSKNVNGTFADLSFHIAPQSFRVGPIEVPQGFGLAGSLNLPPPSEFNASFDIEISPTSVHVDGHIKNALVFPANGPRSFALFHVSSPSKGPSIDMTITTDSFRCDLSAEVYFLGLSAGISAQISENGVEIHEFIFAWVGGAKLDVVADKDMFSLSMSCTLGLTIPPFLIGNTKVPSVDTVQFSASLATRVIWSEALWELAVTGDLSLMWWHLGTHTFTLDANFSDLEQVVQRIAEKIKELYTSAFVTQIEQMLEDSVWEVVNFLSRICMAAIPIGELLVQYFGCQIGEVVKGLGEAFDLSVGDLIPIMNVLGADLQYVVQILFQWGNDLESACR